MGFGVYLVFWFGTEAKQTPVRPDGAERPQTAKDLEKTLVDDLPAELRGKTSVIVLDVSRPDEMITKLKGRERKRLEGKKNKI